MSLFIFTLRQVNEGGEMFGGKHKTIPFPTNKQNNSRLLFIFTCLGVFQLPTLNLGIPSQCPHYKLRVRNKNPEEKQNI